MNDELNTGDESDRIMAWWELKSQRVIDALEGKTQRIHSLPPHAEVVPLPVDIVDIRTHDPAAAHQWRVAVREEILSALSRGLTLLGLDENDFYVFAPVSEKS